MEKPESRSDARPPAPGSSPQAAVLGSLAVLGLLGLGCAGSDPIDSDGSGSERGLEQRVTRDGPALLVPNRASIEGPCAACCPESMRAIGSQVWVEGIAQDGLLEVTSVASDARGNALVGRASGETFKIGTDGRRIWSQPFGASVATDQLSNVYVAGTLDAPLEIGGVLLSPLGDTDVYVMKLDPNGSVVYGVRLGAQGDESTTAIAVDAAGNVVVSGAGLGTLKLGPSGEVLWQKSVHGHVAIDSRGDVLIAGAFSRTLDLGGGQLTSAGGQDVFIAKLDGDGKHLFSRRFGDAGAEQRVQAIAVDAEDNLLVSGVFDGSLDFGSGPLGAVSDACRQSTSCEWGGFVAKFDSVGSQVWSQARFPVRSLVGIGHDSHGDVIVSGAYPDDVPPYSVPVLLVLDGQGSELHELVGWPQPRGAGHRVAVDVCDNVFWTLSALPKAEAHERSYLVKLAL